MSAQGQAKPYDPADPKFAYYVDQVTRAAGLEPLRGQTPTRGLREIRLWDGFGLFAPTPSCSPASGRVTAQRYRRTTDFEMCEATLPRGQTWARILERLDSLGVATLAEQSELNPPGGIGLDGFTLVVEIRDRERYRAYSYWSPVPDAPQQEVRTAAAILQVMGMAGARD